MSMIPKYGFKAEDLIEKGLTTKLNVEDIKKWLKYKPNIPEMSDEQIVLFLIACENVIENTQNAIESYFKHKSSSPGLFANRDMDSEEMQFTFGVTKFALLPTRTSDNCAIIVAELRDTNYYNYNLEPQAKAAFTIMETMVYSDPPKGFIFVMSIKGVGIMHLTKLKLGVIKQAISYLQEGLPAKLIQVHIVNASYMLEKLLFITKPFMKKELYEMIIPHSPDVNMDEFFEKYIPAKCLPADFGGELPYLDQLGEELQNEIRKLKSFFEMNEKQVKLYRKDV